MRVPNLLIPGCLVAALALPAAALASTTPSSGAGSAAPASGGAGIAPSAPAPSPTPAPAPTPAPGTPAPSTPAHPTVPGLVAKIVGGVAYAPASAPIQVQKAIWAGDQIRRKPYVYGGGHAKFNSSGYDCSGSVSYVLHGGGLLRHPMDSSDFMGWASYGVGTWITVYTNPGHAFIEIAGIRFDTSAEADPHAATGSGPRWRPLYPNPDGFQARHPAGF